MVQALYIDPRGPENCWGAARDAQGYDGPETVVAHPPCGPYSKQRHNYKGAEHACALRAVQQVRAFGGVLEHPAHSQLWRVAGLPTPGAGRDAHGGFSVEVCQCDWGHVARKRTWIYVVGASKLLRESIARECYLRGGSAQPTHWASGSRTAVRGPVPPGIKVCSAVQRNRTPKAFALWLISIAERIQQERQLEALAA